MHRLDGERGSRRGRRAVTASAGRGPRPGRAPHRRRVAPRRGGRGGPPGAIRRESPARHASSTSAGIAVASAPAPRRLCSSWSGSTGALLQQQGPQLTEPARQPKAVDRSSSTAASGWRVIRISAAPRRRPRPGRVTGVDPTDDGAQAARRSGRPGRTVAPPGTRPRPLLGRAGSASTILASATPRRGSGLGAMIRATAIDTHPVLGREVRTARPPGGPSTTRRPRPSQTAHVSGRPVDRSRTSATHRQWPCPGATASASRRGRRPAPPGGLRRPADRQTNPRSATSDCAAAWTTAGSARTSRSPTSASQRNRTAWDEAAQQPPRVEVGQVVVHGTNAKRDHRQSSLKTLREWNVTRLRRSEGGMRRNRATVGRDDPHYNAADKDVDAHDHATSGSAEIRECQSARSRARVRHARDCRSAFTWAMRHRPGR